MSVSSAVQNDGKMVRDVSEILKECGWTDGFRIPVSNEENKKLENEVEDKMKKKAQLLVDVEEATERLETIKKHLISADKQRKQCQELLHETRKELDSAQHIDKLCRNERESLEKETRNADKELENITEICEKLQADLCRREAQVGKARKLMRCDSQELLSWSEKHNQGEEDLKMLQSDLMEDAGVYRDLEVKRERLQMEVEQKRKIADSATTEVAVLEETLDRTAQLYRQMHDERGALLKQWEASVRALHRKDQDINRALSEIDTLRGQGRLRMAELIEAKEMLQNLRANNTETEIHIAETQRLLTSLREQDTKLQKDVNDLQNELVSVQRMITSTNKRLEATLNENKRLGEEKCQKEERIQLIRTAIAELEKSYDEACKGAMSAEQRSSQMDALIKAEEQQSNLFNMDICRLQGALFRMQNEYKEFQHQEKMREIEIDAIKKKGVSMVRAKKTLEKNFNQVHEQLYGLELEEQNLKSKLNNLTGEGCASAEQQQKQTLRLQLEQTLRDKKEVLNLLISQADRLELDSRQLTNMITATNAELSRVKNDRSNLQLMVDGGKKALKSAKTSLNDSLVELAVLRVKTKEIKNAEKREACKVFCLKKQKIEYEHAAKERLMELKTERDNFIAKRKTLMEDRSMITSELNANITKNKQLAAKFDIISDSIGRDEFGEFLSPTQLKLKMAQERILLVEEGDILDAKIRKAEKEIEAMENTLKVVNVSNENYRNRLAIIDPEGPEANELKEMEHKYLETMLALKKCREQQTKAEAKIKELQQQLQLIENQTSETIKLQQCRAEAAADLSHELQEQDVKLHRAESQLNRIIRDLRNRSNSAMFIMEEKDIMIRDITDQNKSALDQLSTLANRFLDTCPVIIRLLEERNLCLPPPKLRGQSESSRSSGSSSSISICSGDSSVSTCTVSGRKLFHSSKLAPYRGTIQTPSQLEFPMKESVDCCAPHSPITLSSETVTIPSVSVLSPVGETVPEAIATAQAEGPYCPGDLLQPVPHLSVATTASVSSISSDGVRRSSSRSISVSGSQGSVRSGVSRRSIGAKETESLLESLTVESLSLTGKRQPSKTSRSSLTSLEKLPTKQKSILSSKSRDKSLSGAPSKLSFAPEPPKEETAPEVIAEKEELSAEAETVQELQATDVEGAEAAEEAGTVGETRQAETVDGLQATDEQVVEGGLEADQDLAGGAAAAQDSGTVEGETDQVETVDKAE